MKSLILASLLLVAANGVAQDCSFWNGPSTGDSVLKGHQNSAYHTNPAGYHYMDAWHNGYCTYSDPLPGTGHTCIAQIDISNVQGVGDTQNFLQNSWQHVQMGVDGSATNANQGQVNATAWSGSVAVACPFASCKITGSPGAPPTFTVLEGTEIWGIDDNYTSLCPAAVCSFCSISCAGGLACPGTQCCIDGWCTTNCGGSARNAPKNDSVDFLAMKDRLQ